MDENRGEELEALRARLRTLEAEIVAERHHAAAAEAVIAASRAAVDEAVTRRVPPAPGRAARRWALGLGSVLVLLSSVMIGLGVRYARWVEQLAQNRAQAEQARQEAVRQISTLEGELARARLYPPPCRAGYGQAGSSGAGSGAAIPARLR